MDIAELPEQREACPSLSSKETPGTGELARNYLQVSDMLRGALLEVRWCRVHVIGKADIWIRKRNGPRGHSEALVTGAKQNHKGRLARKLE